MDIHSYTPITKDELVKDIKKTKELNNEQFIFMFKNFLEAYKDGVKTFGFRDPFNKYLREKMLEYMNILKQEAVYFNYILDNINVFNLDAIDRLLDDFESINEKTVIYYDDFFDKASFAAISNDPRLLYSRRHDDTLIESDFYAKQVAGLALNDKAIRDYLGYDDGFWDFIKGTTNSLETTPDIGEKMAYAVPIHDKDGYVSMIKLFVPKVVDLETAIITLKTYSEAHDYYLNYLHKVSNNDVCSFDKDKFIDSIDISTLKLRK